MIIPVGDLVKRRSMPVMNWLFILLNVAVFAHAFIFRPEQRDGIYEAYALVPSRWTDFKTFLTSMFLHGDVVHLAGNMLFLYIAGDNVEDRLGHLGYVVFYLLAGLAGAAAHVGYAMVLAPSMASIPTVGASGAISGLMGAFLAFHPKGQVKFILWLLIFVRAFTLPAWGAVGLWVASQIVMARNQLDGIGDKETQMVAVFAHLGGFAFGLVAALLVRLMGKSPSKG
jgi:membrane associated rhomboid family serine protease